jgi:hypothetical protein
LELNLVLDNESLALVLNWFWELGRNSMMGRGILNHKTLITLHSLVYIWLLYSPLANICPLLIIIRALGVLLGMRRLPSLLPVICELLNEVCLESGRLQKSQNKFPCD